MTPLVPTLESLIATETGLRLSPTRTGFRAALFTTPSPSKPTHRRFPELPSLRSAQFAFVGPASGVLTVLPELLRAGRSASFVGVDVRGAGVLAMRATLTSGAARNSRHRFLDLAPPEAKPLENGFSLFAAPGKPRSTVNFEGRFVGGGVPFSSARPPGLVPWFSHKPSAQAGDAGDNWLLARTDGAVASDAHSLQSSVFWNAAGHPVLTSRQLVALHD